MIVAGVGFSSTCGAAELADLVRRAQAAAGVAATALAAPAWKADAACLANAAAALDLPILPIDRDRLAAADTPTHSPVSRAATGAGSAAEACALAAVGPGARLILPRIASAHATCALSEGDPS